MESEPKVLSKPKLKKKLSTSDDMKALMASRRQMTDEFVSESPQTAEEIKNLASDIAKTFGSEGSDSPKQPIGKAKEGRKESGETKSTESGTVSDESEPQQFGPCGKPEGCGTDDELDKRLSKEFDILPTLGSKLNEGPAQPIPFKDKVIQDELATLESTPQRYSFIDEADSALSGDDKVIKKQESMETVETSAKESDTESEAEMNAKEQVKDEIDDGSDDDDDQDFLSSESENDKEKGELEEDNKEPDEGVEKVDGNTKSRLSTDRPLSYTSEDIRTKKLIKEDEERPKSFTFGEEGNAEDRFISSKYVDCSFDIK